MDRLTALGAVEDDVSLAVSEQSPAPSEPGRGLSAEQGPSKFGAPDRN